RDDRPLADEQKAAIAEVREWYKAKVAECEILHQAALRKARSHEEIERLNKNLRSDNARLRDALPASAQSAGPAPRDLARDRGHPPAHRTHRGDRRNARGRHQASDLGGRRDRVWT